MVLVIVTGADSSGEETFRWSSGVGFIDALGRVYEPRVIQAGNYQRFLVRQGGLIGRSEVGYGETVINNADGALDRLLNFAFDGRDILIQSETGAVFLRGTVGGVVFDRRSVVFRIRDFQQVVSERPVVSATFAGTNSGGVGLEGTAGDIKGLNKPRGFGRFRVAPVAIVNTSQLIAQISTGPLASIETAQDGGSVLTNGGNYGTLADLQATSPSPGNFRTFLGSSSEGAFIRLGSAPNRVLTVDATEGSASSDRTVAQIARRVLINAGLTPAQITGADVVDSSAGWLAGIYCSAGDAVMTGEILDLLMTSVHGYWIAQRDGTVRLGLIRAPAAPIKATIEEWQILQEGSAIERVVGDGEGLPIWKISVKYQRVWRQMSRDQLAGVALIEQERLGREFRVSTRQDQSVRDRYRLAKELTVETALDTELDAANLRDVLWNLYSVQRDTFTIALSRDQAQGLDLDDVINLRVNRFGLSAGRLMRVIGIVEDVQKSRTTLTVWG